MPLKKAFLALAVSVAILAGCGGIEYKPPDYSPYVWPIPPDKARVKLLNVIRTDLDLRTRKTAELLFGGEASFGFVKPHAVAADNKGNIYVTDPGRRMVTRLNPETGSITDIPNPLNWKLPLAVAVDEKNRLLAVGNDKIVQIFNLDSLGHISVIGQGHGLKVVAGLAFDPERRILYVADSKDHAIYSYGYDGKRIAKLAEIGNEKGKVYFPVGLASDKAGNLYVVDSMNWRVQVFSPEGEVIHIFGEHGDLPGMFARPKGIAVTREGYLLITDAAYGNYQIMDKNGKVYLFVGSPGRGFGSFTVPQGIAVNDNDRIVVVDSLNRRVQLFQLMTDRYYEAMESAPTAETPKK